MLFVVSCMDDVCMSGLKWKSMFFIKPDMNARMNMDVSVRKWRMQLLWMMSEIESEQMRQNDWV